MSGDKQRRVLNEGEECARMKDSGSWEIDSWWVRGDFVIQSHNKGNQWVIDEGAACDHGGRFSQTNPQVDVCTS